MARKGGFMYLFRMSLGLWPVGFPSSSISVILSLIERCWEVGVCVVGIDVVGCSWLATLVIGNSWLF